MSKLLELQHMFALSVSSLIREAHMKGFQVTLGETYRSPEEAQRCAENGTGIKDSLHTQRLAIDLNFFVDGRWITDTRELKAIGEWWKSLGPVYRWGGDFKTRPDGNHFSITPDGVRA